MKNAHVAKSQSGFFGGDDEIGSIHDVARARGNEQGDDAFDRLWRTRTGLGSLALGRFVIAALGNDLRAEAFELSVQLDIELPLRRFALAAFTECGFDAPAADALEQGTPALPRLLRTAEQIDQAKDDRADDGTDDTQFVRAQSLRIHRRFLRVTLLQPIWRPRPSLPALAATRPAHAWSRRTTDSPLPWSPCCG